MFPQKIFEALWWLRSKHNFGLETYLWSGFHHIKEELHFKAWWCTALPRFGGNTGIERSVCMYICMYVHMYVHVCRSVGNGGQVPDRGSE